MTSTSEVLHLCPTSTQTLLPFLTKPYVLSLLCFFIYLNFRRVGYMVNQPLKARLLILDAKGPHKC